MDEMKLSFPNMTGERLTRVEADEVGNRMRAQLESYLSTAIESRVVPDPPALERVTITGRVPKSEVKAYSRFLLRPWRIEGHWQLDYTDARCREGDCSMDVSALFRLAEITVGEAAHVEEQADVWLVLENLRPGFTLVAIAGQAGIAEKLAEWIKPDGGTTRVVPAKVPAALIHDLVAEHGS